MERAVVLTQGGGQPQASPALGDLVAQYSTILASQVRCEADFTCLIACRSGSEVVILVLVISVFTYQSQNTVLLLDVLSVWVHDGAVQLVAPVLLHPWRHGLSIIVQHLSLLNLLLSCKAACDA